MTKEEAKLFFHWEEDQTAEDSWEEKLFEFKQFFLTRPPIPQVFLSRLKKLEKMRDAYLVLTDQSKEEEVVEEHHDKTYDFSDKVIEAFNLQQGFRMKVKSELLRSNTFSAIQNSIMNWLTHEKSYMLKWRLNEPIDKSDILISKEPDPMELLEEIRQFEKRMGALTFEKVKNDLERLPDMIKNESKRLTLLFDKNYG